MLLNFSKLLSILFALHFGVLAVSAQKPLISGEFAKIIPGVTTRQEIEKRFGTVNLINDFMAQYTTEDFSISVEYSTSDCNSGNVPWALPKDTVEMITYWFPEEKRRSLTDVILKISEFTGKVEGDVGHHITYRNRGRGIYVIYSTNIKAVRSITLEPTAKQKKKFTCRN
jgi:hypothetical protein